MSMSMSMLSGSLTVQRTSTAYIFFHSVNYECCARQLLESRPKWFSLRFSFARSFSAVRSSSARTERKLELQYPFLLLPSVLESQNKEQLCGNAKFFSFLIGTGSPSVACTCHKWLNCIARPERNENDRREAAERRVPRVSSRIFHIYAFRFSEYKIERFFQFQPEATAKCDLARSKDFYWTFISAFSISAIREMKLN